jgi:hypothetical protein
MRSAKFTAPDQKEVEKTKIVQLNQDTVNKRVADFKAARLACLIPKSKPSLLTQFTPEEILVLGMRDDKLKYLTDEDLLTKYDEVEKERQERLKGQFAPYLSRDRLRLFDPKTVAHIYGYNVADTSTTNDMEVAATLQRTDPQGMQNIIEYDDHVIGMLNQAFKVRDLSVIKRMLSEVKLNPKGPGAIKDKAMTYALGLMLVDAKIDPEALRTKEAKDMMTEALCKSIGEVAKDLGQRMEVLTKNKGLSVEEFCEDLMQLATKFEKVDDPFGNFQNGGGATALPPVDQGARRGGPGLGTRREADGGGAKTTAPTATKTPYFDGNCSHCQKRGHMEVNCRNKHLPAVKRDQGGGHGHVQGGGQGHVQQGGPSRKVAAAFKKLTIEEYQHLKANQKP